MKSMSAGRLRSDLNFSLFRMIEVWVMAAIVFGLMYGIFPEYLQEVVVEYILRNGVLFLVWVPAIWTVYRYFYGDYESERRIIVSGVTFFLFAIGVMLLIGSIRGYLTYSQYAKYELRNALVETSSRAIRYTPLMNACTDLANPIKTTSEHVSCDHVSPVIYPDGTFGYVAPIDPSGLYQVLEKQNPGFMQLRDSREFAHDQSLRIRRIDDPQKYGLDMQWFDNLERRLVWNDFFASYGKPHYLALDASQPNKLTTVVPKIEYKWLFQLRIWGGVVLVHADGKIEDLSKQQALADPRLKGKWIYPLELEERYIRAQNFSVGWGLLSPYVRVPGKLEIEKLSGSNQFPFLTQGADGNPYLVTATKGEGSARGLFRMYYRNAFTGDGSYYEFSQQETAYGAGAALERMSNIQGYAWSTGKGGGTIQATEPVYIKRPGDAQMYWKFTVTNLAHSGISATAVVPAAKPDEIKLYHTRDEFDLWLEGRIANSTPSVVDGTTGVKEKINAIITQIEAKLGELKQLAEQAK